MSRYGGTNVRTSALRWPEHLALPYHEHLAYRITNISRYGGTHSRATAARTLVLRRHALSRCNIKGVRTSRTASRTFRATVARTLTLPYQGCPRYGNTNVRAIVANPARYFTCDNWPGNCDDRQYKPSKIFYARQLAGQLSRQTIQTQQDILRATIGRAIVTTDNTNPARYFTRDNWPGNCHDGQYKPSKIFYAQQLPGQLSRRLIRTQQDILRATIAQPIVMTDNTKLAKF